MTDTILIKTKHVIIHCNCIQRIRVTTMILGVKKIKNQLRGKILIQPERRTNNVVMMIIAMYALTWQKRNFHIVHSIASRKLTLSKTKYITKKSPASGRCI